MMKNRFEILVDQTLAEMGGLFRRRRTAAPAPTPIAPEPPVLPSQSLPPPGDLPFAEPRSGAPARAIALQGGGAYGAYAWGVLDRLLEEEDFATVGLSGASAGAINAVVLAYGLLCGGREGARAALRHVWGAISNFGRLSPLGLPGASLQFDLMTRVLSPYQFNPLNINPLRDLLSGAIDFDRLHRENRIPLFIAATNVRTGKARIFRETEITADVLLASTSIPFLAQAVEIDGEAYWDGGFSANPPFLPLLLETECTEVVLVKLTPETEPDLPTAASGIFARMRRMMFNAPLIRDLDALDEMKTLLRRTRPLPPDLARLRDLKVDILSIDHEFFAGFNGSALDPKPEMLNKLFEAGRAAAEPAARNLRMEDVAVF